MNRKNKREKKQTRCRNAWKFACPQAGILHADASFTVEAALLMTIIVPVLIALLITGFFLHDQGYLQGTATELCAMQSNLRLYDDAASQTEKVRKHRLKQGTLWSRNLSGAVQSSEEKAGADMDGTFPLPGLTGALLPGDLTDMSAHWDRRMYDPAPLIRKIRAAKHLIDDLAF